MGHEARDENRVAVNLRTLKRDDLLVADLDALIAADLAGELGLDSLELVELTMELEEEFDLDLPDEDARQLKTLGDVLRYFARRRRKET